MAVPTLRGRRYRVRPATHRGGQATVRDVATGGLGGGIRQQLRPIRADLLVVAADPKDSPARSKYPGDRNQV